jgi:CPA1 family monovalent cation:H+ antiporter
VVLVGRFISVAIPYSILDKHIKKFPWFNIKVVTMMSWSGLRGALAFALALSIDNPEHGTFFIFLTYCVVAFSIIVQGLTIPKLVKALKL